MKISEELRHTLKETLEAIKHNTASTGLIFLISAYIVYHNLDYSSPSKYVDSLAGFTSTLTGLIGVVIVLRKEEEKAQVKKVENKSKKS